MSEYCAIFLPNNSHLSKAVCIYIIVFTTQQIQERECDWHWEYYQNKIINTETVSRAVKIMV